MVRRSAISKILIAMTVMFALLIFPGAGLIEGMNCAYFRRNQVIKGRF